MDKNRRWATTCAHDDVVEIAGLTEAEVRELLRRPLTTASTQRVERPLPNLRLETRRGEGERLRRAMQHRVVLAAQRDEARIAHQRFIERGLQGERAPVAGIVTVVSLVPATAVAHERKEVAGLMVLFGAEPEAALTEEVEYLRWRFTSPESHEPFTELEEVSAAITRNGREFGPFEARSTRRDPGLRQTRHIFSEPGEYDVVLTFKKAGDPTVHSIAFAFMIRNRKDLEIPD